MYNTRVVRILVKIKIGERLQENDRNKKMHAVIQENVVNFSNDNIRSEARFKVIVVGCLFMVHGTCIYFVLIYACTHIHAFMHARVIVLFIPTYVCIHRKLPLSTNISWN